MSNTLLQEVKRKNNKTTDTIFFILKLGINLKKIKVSQRH